MIAVALSVLCYLAWVILAAAAVILNISFAMFIALGLLACLALCGIVATIAEGRA